MAVQKRYSHNQSPLYALNSKRKLAELLGIPLKDLLFLASLQDDNYQTWPLQQKRRDIIAGFPPSKPRGIQQPMPLLRVLHDRLAILLARIERPDFVYSATKGRSYLDNALQHKDMCAHPACKIDIRSFYPSVKQRWVRRFFFEDLRCPADLAHFLACLCCVNGALPTGSPLSPVLSYFACAPLFKRFEEIALEHGLKFTLYVDDMFFSGPAATRAFSNRILMELANNGFKGHKVSHFRAGQTRVITGVAISTKGIAIPFKRQTRIRLYEKAFARTNDLEEIRILGRTLLGQYREGERLQHGSRERAKPVQDRIDAIEAAYFSDVTEVAPKRKKRKHSRESLLETMNKLRERKKAEKNEKPVLGI